MELDDAVDLLYGLDPTEFTARRDALAAEARTAGDRPLATAIKALRRPSVAAYAVNLLARELGDQVAQLIDLGHRLQQAQEALSAEEIRALGRQRHQLIAGMAQQAASLARDGGPPVSESALREIESTLEAALGDEGAAAAVRQGCLVRSLSRTGLDPVDLTGAVAVGERGGEGTEKAGLRASTRKPSSRTSSSRTPAGGRDAGEPAADQEKARREADLAEARSAAEWARAVMRREQERLAKCDEALAGATAAREAADRHVEALQQQLAEARRDADAAADEERQARRARADAATDAESAEAAAQRAEDRLSGLESAG